MRADIVSNFYCRTTESILSDCITVWHGSCSSSFLFITGNKFPALQDIYQTCCLRKAHNIIKIRTHPAFFFLLTSCSWNCHLADVSVHIHHRQPAWRTIFISKPVVLQLALRRFITAIPGHLDIYYSYLPLTLYCTCMYCPALFNSTVNGSGLASDIYSQLQLFCLRLPKKSRT